MSIKFKRNLKNGLVARYENKILFAAEAAKIYLIEIFRKKL